MMQQFVDRENELEALERAWKSEGPEMIVIYGRRRVGKTALALRFIEGKPAVYFLADERGEENLREFRRKIAQFFGDPVLERSDLGWLELFEYLARKGEKLVVVIDELPYIVEHDGAFPSVLQKAWDSHLQGSPLKLVLVGSSIGMMEDLLGHKSPLYGRRTMQIELKPLRYWHVREFLPSYSEEDLMRVYGAVDGIPLYLRQFRDELSFWENLKNLMLRKESFLYAEAEFLLRQEFREPARYFAILRAISLGKTRHGEIVDYTGFDRGVVSKYLDNLARIGVIRKVYPAFEPEKRRNMRYEMADNYYAFWFRFVYPNRELVERELYGEALKIVRRDYDHYMGRVLEKASLDFLWKRFAFERAGRWWGKREEIDIVGLKGGTAHFFEVKWKELKEREARGILKDLERKAELVSKLKDLPRRFGLVARRIEGKERLADEGYLVFDLKDMFKP
ncbi:MAG: uncharacterized protein PWQ95_2010 [Thermococcaceae archaeon]|nr:uncharacterized protein [Thermococcaceae archaeon]